MNSPLDAIDLTDSRLEDRRRCSQKRLYHSPLHAAHAASEARKRHEKQGNPKNIRPYKCQACYQYHLTSH